MSNYIIYKCSVCRRTKDVLRDDTRAIPNHCVITKGCSGSLQRIGETSSPTSTTSQAGVVDWYPRGLSTVATALAPSNNTISMSCSASGVVTMAVKSVSEPAAELTLELIQRKIDDISFTLYKMPVSVDILSGQDTTGKRLRLAEGIDPNRVTVRIFNISVGFTLSLDTITLDSSFPSGTIADVSVQSIPDTIFRNLVFVANHSTVANVTSGAWGNVKWIKDVNGDKWWLYSCGALSGLPTSSRFKIHKVYQNSVEVSMPFIFLFASTPFENVDRYVQFYIDGDYLKEDFHISTEMGTVNEFYADKTSLVEIYPPFKLIYDSVIDNSSFVSDDKFTTSGNMSTDTTLTRFSGSKIIGPV